MPTPALSVARRSPPPQASSSTSISTAVSNPSSVSEPSWLRALVAIDAVDHILMHEMKGLSVDGYLLFSRIDKY